MKHAARALLRGAALAAVVLVVAAWTSRAAGPTPPVDAAQLFLRDCAACHGSNGRGSTLAPSLVDVGAASIDFQLSTGRMPLIGSARTNAPGRPVAPRPGEAPFEADATTDRHAPAYDAATIDALVRYIESLTGGGGPPIPALRPGDVAEGGTVYRLQCAACHEWAGSGGVLYRREAPPTHAATAVQVAEAVRTGPGQMPAFGRAAVTDRQLDDLVSYVEYLDAPDDRGGAALGHVGPVAEGAVALAGVGAITLLLRWIGQRG